MATSAQIQAALADAQQNDLEWSDMAVLLKRAITNALINASGEVTLPWTTTNVDGTSVTRISIVEAQTLYQRLNNLGSGGVVSQYAEFTEPQS